MATLAQGLMGVGMLESALNVTQANLALLQSLMDEKSELLVDRAGGPGRGGLDVAEEHETDELLQFISDELDVKCDVARIYQYLERWEDALVIEREVYDKSVQMCKLDGYETLVSGLNLCCTLVSLKKFEEARPFLRKLIGRSRLVSRAKKD